MSGKIFSVDEAIAEQRPRVELRGDLYEIQDLPLWERLKRMLALAEAEEKKRENEGIQTSDEDVFLKLRDVYAKAIQEVLVGVPDDVANSITEHEFSLIQQSILVARNIELKIAEKKSPVAGQ